MTSLQEQQQRLLVEGDVVRVTDLATSSQYNGQRGEVCAESEQRQGQSGGRLGVRLVDEPFIGKILSCRPQNLILLRVCDEETKGQSVQEDVEKVSGEEEEINDVKDEEKEEEDTEDIKNGHGHADTEEEQRSQNACSSPLKQEDENEQESKQKKEEKQQQEEEEDEKEDEEEEEEEEEVPLPSLSELGSSFDDMVQKIHGLGSKQSGREQHQQWEAAEEEVRKKAFAALHPTGGLLSGVDKDLQKRMTRLTRAEDLVPEGRLANRNKNNSSHGSSHGSNGRGGNSSSHGSNGRGSGSRQRPAADHWREREREETVFDPHTHSDAHMHMHMTTTDTDNDTGAPFSEYDDDSTGHYYEDNAINEDYEEFNAWRNAKNKTNTNSYGGNSTGDGDGDGDDKSFWSGLLSCASDLQQQPSSGGKHV